MSGAALEDAEDLGRHLLSEFPDISGPIRGVLNAPWYSKAPVAGRLKCLTVAIHDVMVHVISEPGHGGPIIVVSTSNPVA
jgi:hypothetical protein